MNKAFKTCLELITQRNYEIESLEELDETLDLQLICKCKYDNKNIYVIAVYENYNTNILKKIIQILNNDNISHAIIIYNQDITSFVKSQNIIAENHIHLENFSKNELIINITKHSLQPLEIIELSNEDVNKIKKYKSKLPILLRSDPICKFYNFSIGSVLKITRRDNSVCLKIVK